MCARISRQFIIPLPLTFISRVHADTGKGRKDWRCARVTSGGDESGGGIIKGGKDRTWKFELVNTRREREKPREGDRLYNYAI